LLAGRPSDSGHGEQGLSIAYLDCHRLWSVIDEVGESVEDYVKWGCVTVSVLPVSPP
jgi:hypothetical protein